MSPALPVSMPGFDISWTKASPLPPHISRSWPGFRPRRPGDFRYPPVWRFFRPRVGVYSLNVGEAESAVVSDVLWQTYHMATRPAYHCAPLIHRSLGTAVQGTVRFSFSQFTTEEDVRAAVQALQDISEL